MLGWGVAIILLVVLLHKHDCVVKMRAQLERLSDSSPRNDNSSENRPIEKQAILDLVILRLNLIRETEVGQLKQEMLHLLDQIDESWQKDLNRRQLTPDSIQWNERRLAAWRILVDNGKVHGSPPWEHDLPASEPIADDETLIPVFEIDRQQLSRPVSLPLKKTVSVGTNLSGSKQSTGGGAEERPQVTTEILPESEKQHAWEPSKPSELEKALHLISGWPKVVLPFLVQNIGWFIGGFCFLAGSIFLVSYTTGFAKGIAVFIALFSYTLFLIWFGYRLQLNHSIAKTGGGVLMTMGMLLVPLNISAAVRLIVNSSGSWLFSGVGCLAAFLAIIIYFYLAKLIAGLVDRTLQGGYPVIFLLLSSIQIGIPLINLWPTWQLMAFFHLLLLGLLSYGFYCYVHDWMHSIFVEQKKIAYFAGGVLLYTTCVSFVHLTWGIESLKIPHGYYAPYLMVVCGLLFYLENRFKQWVHQNIFLSRFTFLIYGLSILAVVSTKEGPTMIITLSLAIIIYGLVVWQYLTLVPLYLLLASLAGLYYVLILQHFAWELSFLLGLPGLACLFILSNYIQGLEDRRSAVYRLAMIIYRVQALLLFILGAWSLFNSQPGMVGFCTALLLTAGSWSLLRSAPGPLLSPLSEINSTPIKNQVRVNLNNTPWLYTVTLSMTAALAFSPLWPNIRWVPKFSLGLMLLACFWTWLAIHFRLKSINELVGKIEVLSNSALLSVIAAFALVYPSRLWEAGELLLPLLATIGAGVLLSLSLGLYARWLFYGFLVLTGSAVELLKIAYFPGTSVGTIKILFGLGLWLGLWWLEQQPDEVDKLRRDKLRLDVPIYLLWYFPISPCEHKKFNSASDKITAGGSNV